MTDPSRPRCPHCGAHPRHQRDGVTNRDRMTAQLRAEVAARSAARLPAPMPDPEIHDDDDNGKQPDRWWQR